MTTSRKTLLVAASSLVASTTALSLAAPARPAPVVSAPLASSDQLWENYARTADMVSEARWLEDDGSMAAELPSMGLQEMQVLDLELADVEAQLMRNSWFDTGLDADFVAEEVLTEDLTRELAEVGSAFLR